MVTRRGAKGSNQYVTRPGSPKGGSPSSGRALAAAVSADPEDVAWAFTEDSTKWRQVGVLDKATAEAWTAAGVPDPGTARWWMESGFTDPALVADWVSQGRTPGVAEGQRELVDEFVADGWSYPQAIAWAYSSLEATHIPHDFLPLEAEGWREVGFTAAEAHAWEVHNPGIRPTEAWKRRRGGHIP